jgi:hypothetical protein
MIINQRPIKKIEQERAKISKKMRALHKLDLSLMNLAIDYNQGHKGNWNKEIKQIKRVWKEQQKNEKNN